MTSLCVCFGKQVHIGRSNHQYYLINKSASICIGPGLPSKIQDQNQKKIVITQLYDILLSSLGKQGWLQWEDAPYQWQSVTFKMLHGVCLLYPSHYLSGLTHQFHL